MTLPKSAPIILSGFRTIVAPRGGSLSNFDIGALAAPVIGRVLRAADLSHNHVDELILSNALGGGGNPARYCALAASLPDRVAGLSIDRQCIGGLDAFNLGAALITSGQAKVVVVGGVESHSQRPLRLKNSSSTLPPLPYYRPAFAPTSDQDPDPDFAMACVAQDHDLSKHTQDAWAIESHRKAIFHQSDLEKEIVELGTSGVRDPYARTLNHKICDRAKIVSGTVTFANTAVAADAAAFAVMVHPSIAADNGLQGVTYVGGVSLGADPRRPALAPVDAIKAVLTHHNLTTGDIDQVEMMEAYAAQAYLCCHHSGLDPAKVNLKGGALARGHPIGASGAILAVRLFHDLLGTGKTGLAAIAAAGGLGTAAVFKG